MVEAASGGDAVRAALQRARAAGPGLPLAAERIAVLGELLETFRDTGSRAHRRWADELPTATGFSPEVVREGLRLGLEGWTGEALADLARRELGHELAQRGPRRLAPFDTVAVVLGGAIPMPTLLQIVAPLVLGSPVVVKPGSGDPRTAQVVAETLAELSPALGNAVEVVHFGRDDRASAGALCEAACLVASGSDATMAALRHRVPPATRFVPYGHRFSVALLDARADAPSQQRALQGLALDLCLWDQLGCLSPAFALVLGAESVPEDLLDGLAEALAARGSQLPRGRVDAAAAASFAHERDEAEMRAAAGRGVGVRRGDEFVLVAEVDAALRAAPGHRFLRLLPVPEMGALPQVLETVGPWLAAIGVPDGPQALDPKLHDLLLGLGASRICGLGSLQTPPLAWSHDGQPVLLPLARFTDLEVPPGG